MKKKEKKICSGINGNGKPCNRIVTDEMPNCKKHKHFQKLTSEQIKDVKLGGNDNLKPCKRCDKWRIKSRYVNDKDQELYECNKCQAERKISNAKVSKKKVNLKCEWYEKNKKKEEENEKKPCRFNKINGTNYCKNHQYVCDYTKEMKEDVVRCSDCGHWKYMEYGTIKGKYQRYKLCEKCINRGKNNREKDKEKKEDDPKCLNEQCTNNVDNEGDYCRKHRRDFLRIESEKKGGRLCGGGLRCEVFLDKDYKKESCADCLKKANKADKIRRDKRKEETKRRIEKGCKELVCWKCGKEDTIDKFYNGHKSLGYKCYDCLKTQQIYNDTREDRRKRYNLNDAANKIIRCAERRKIDLSITKSQIKNIITNSCTYCGKLDSEYGTIDRIDNTKGYIDGNVCPSCILCNYFKYTYNLEEFLQYCENINENFGCKELAEKNRKHRTYKLYEYDAFRRNIEFNITESEFYNKIKYKCYYCADTNYNNIGIDRYDSTIGYISDNIVACCKICNYMKKNFETSIFKNQIKDIVEFNKTKKDYTSIKKIPKNISREWIIQRLLEINKLKEDDNKTIVDNRNKHKFLHDDKYYNSMVYNTYNIDEFEPEIEFCKRGSKEQFDIWMYYRLKISSFSYSISNGRTIYMLIRDKKTKKYVGIASLASDMLFGECRDNFIGWSKEVKIDDKKINNIMNISTCVGIPPFSFNYNGGKLIAMLMFSNEVYDYFKKTYNDELVALTTFSLYGKSIQYDRLKELKFIGYTKGFGVIHLKNDKLYDACLEYMDQHDMNYKRYKSKMHKLNYLIKSLGLPSDLLLHNNKKGVYFGWCGTEGKDYITGITDNFKPDLLQSIDDIGKYWKNRWAHQRFNNLLNTSRLMLNYNFDNNIINDKDIIKRNVQNYRKQKNENNTNKKKLTDKNIIEIIKYHTENRNLTNYKLAKHFTEKFGINIDHKKIKSILMR